MILGLGSALPAYQRQAGMPPISVIRDPFPLKAYFSSAKRNPSDPFAFLAMSIEGSTDRQWAYPIGDMPNGASFVHLMDERGQAG